MRFATCRFSPHRHDTYAIGITTAGVQEFRYRGGAASACPASSLSVSRRDARRRPGDRRRLRLPHPLCRARARPGGARRKAAALRRRARPGLDAGDPELRRLLDRIDDPVSDLGRHEAASAIAEALVALGGGTEREGRIDLAAVARVRSYIAAHAPSRRRHRRSSGSPASTATRSPASSGAPTARAPTGTAPCAAWRWRGRRSRRACRSRVRQPTPASPTRAT